MSRRHWHLIALAGSGYLPPEEREPSQILSLHKRPQLGGLNLDRNRTYSPYPDKAPPQGGLRTRGGPPFWLRRPGREVVCVMDRPRGPPGSVPGGHARVGPSSVPWSLEAELQAEVIQARAGRVLVDTGARLVEVELDLETQPVPGIGVEQADVLGQALRAGTVGGLIPRSPGQ